MTEFKGKLLKETRINAVDLGKSILTEKLHLFHHWLSVFCAVNTWFAACVNTTAHTSHCVYMFAQAEYITLNTNILSHLSYPAVSHTGDDKTLHSRSDQVLRPWPDALHFPDRVTASIPTSISPSTNRWAERWSSSCVKRTDDSHRVQLIRKLLISFECLRPWETLQLTNKPDTLTNHNLRFGSAPLKSVQRQVKMTSMQRGWPLHACVCENVRCVLARCLVRPSFSAEFNELRTTLISDSKLGLEGIPLLCQAPLSHSSSVCFDLSGTSHVFLQPAPAKQTPIDSGRSANYPHTLAIMKRPNVAQGTSYTE